MFFLWRKKCKGYTLVEIMAALGAFSIIMIAITQIFSRGITSYREVHRTQVNLEAAQAVLNLMAKELRTSSVVDSSLGATVSTIKFFDYSQNRCIEYSFDESNGQVTKRSTGYTDPDPTDNAFDEQWNYCNGVVLTGAAQPLLTGLMSQTVDLVASLAPPNQQVGKVTISLTIGQGSSSTTIQTTVSLRDFNYTAT